MLGRSRGRCRGRRRRRRPVRVSGRRCSQSQCAAALGMRQRERERTSNRSAVATPDPISLTSGEATVTARLRRTLDVDRRTQGHSLRRVRDEVVVQAVHDGSSDATRSQLDTQRTRGRHVHLRERAIPHDGGPDFLRPARGVASAHAVITIRCYPSRSHCAADRATHQAPRTSAYAATQALPLQIRHTRVMRYLPTQHQ